MPTLQATVKAVLSGDTIILHAVNNPAQERHLNLAAVSAPRLRREGDEPFAYASREYLARALVGKTIQFQVLYNGNTGLKPREFGTVTLPDQTTFPQIAVADGWVKVREDPGTIEGMKNHKHILETMNIDQARAKADSKGLWSAEGGRVDCQYEIPDTTVFAEKHKDKNIEASVERVLTGDRMIVRLKIEPVHHIQTLVLVAGIRAPSTRRTLHDGKEQAAEPFGEQAQRYLETRLHQRIVNIEILGVSPQGQLVCNIKHPKNGSIAIHLLKEGLARCTDYHSTMLGTEMAQFRQAEKEAKDKKVKLFQGHAPVKAAADLEVTVTKVQTADTIYTRSKSGDEKRMSLSSIRQPKPSDPKQAPFQAEAKEFLRKKLIGKHVRITIDGKKAASEGFEEREVVTVNLNNKNVALLLVEAGYASVIRHRRDDEDRSPYYDELLATEEVAIKEEKGMWSPKPPAAKNYQDYSESLQKAKVQASVLQRQKRIPAVVDFVKGGSRFTVIIPRENAKLTFVLSCIRAPRSARNASESSEPFGQEAHDLANRRCNQRDVEIDIEGTDKVGGFIGSLYVNRENFAKLLLEEGLATVHAYSAEQSSNGPELLAAEERAKEARKGLWHDYDPSKGVDDESTSEPASTNGTHTNGDTPAAARKLDYREVCVTHIDPATLRLKLQLIGPGTVALTDLMARFRTHHLSPSSAPLPTPPKAGEYVSAKFSEDNTWYRARIRRNDREAKASEIIYIDYGNEEKLPWSQLRPLPAQFSIQTLRPQAQDAVLAFCQFSANSEYVADAYTFLAERIAGREMVANVEATDAKDGGVMYVTLFEKDLAKAAHESFNADVVGEGLAMVPRKLKAWERAAPDILKGLADKEKEAREGKKGVWEYGDLSED